MENFEQGSEQFDRDIQPMVSIAFSLKRIADAQVEGVPVTKIRETLKDHWLTQIRCDHANKTDKASCACSEMAGPECNSVGEAVESWIDHFIEQLQS